MKVDYSMYTFVTSVAILVLQLQIMIDPRLRRTPDTVLQVTPAADASQREQESVHAGTIFEGEWGPQYSDVHIPHPSYVFVAGPNEAQPPVDSVAGLIKLRVAANTQRAILTAANRMPPETSVSRMIAEQTRRYLAEDARSESKAEALPVKTVTPVSVTAPGLGAATRRVKPTEPFDSMSTLITYVSTRLDNKFGVVLGVGHGEFTKRLLQSWQRSYLYLVDPYIHIWRGYDDASNVDDKAHQLIFERLRSEIHSLSGRFTFVRDFSTEFAKTYAAAANQPPASFVWIDANPSYKAVSADLTSWYSLVESGGIIAGSSYVNGKKIEVKRAVDDFVAGNGLNLHVLTNDMKGGDPVWAMVKP